MGQVLCCESSRIQNKDIKDRKYSQSNIIGATPRTSLVISDAESEGGSSEYEFQPDYNDQYEN